MRLLHTTTIKLSSFDGDDSIPPYAILSHTWGNAEISFHDLSNYAESELNESDGYKKIRSCCALAADEGHEYVWIDTCCIDKNSSAELSEAINSMYRWYQKAKICYAYLADVRIGDHDLGGSKVEEAFGKSRWFTRGWTLQELLAPKDVFFYDQNWQKLGSKSSLEEQISFVTGIQRAHIHDINGASAAQKMSWASKRQTRRVEDVSYSLMGIFDVNMPLLYGEGKKAFLRLQHEIVKISNDESLFAWTDGGLVESGLFAQSPKAFAKSEYIVPFNSEDYRYIHRAPYMVTNRGLAIETLHSRDGSSTFVLDRRFAILPLNCGRQPGIGYVRDEDDQLAIGLENVSRDEFVRFSPGELDRLPWEDTGSVRLAYVRPGFIPYDSHGQRLSLFIDGSSLSKCMLIIADCYHCSMESQRGIASGETLVRITLRHGESFAALLSYHSGEYLGIIIRAAESTLSISLIEVSSLQNFDREMDEYKCRQIHPSSADPAPFRLKDCSCVSVALREKKVGASQKHFLAEFVLTGGNDIYKRQKLKMAGEQASSGHATGWLRWLRWYVRS